MRVWLAIALCACSKAEPPQPPAPPVVDAPPAPSPPAKSPTVIWLGGDVLLSVAIREHVQTFEDPSQGMASIVEPLARLWRQDPGAFVLINLETPIATRRYGTYSEPPREHGPTPVHLNAPPWLATGLAQAGVDAVSLANNHALDQDEEGLIETIDTAYRAGLMVTGAGRGQTRAWPLVIGENSSTVALHSFFDGYYMVRGEPEPEPGDAIAGVSRLDEAALEQIRVSSESNETVIVMVHVLGELRRTPKQRWRWWAERVAEAGADLIVVGGTHVVMPVETLQVGQRQVPIIWGLGNLITDMGPRANPRHRTTAQTPKTRSAEVREALVARIEIEDGELDIRFVAGWMHDDRFARWHMGTQEGEIAFAILPMSSCDPPAPVPGDAPAWIRDEIHDWIRRRHAHVAEASGLVPDECRPSSRPWLRYTGAR